jgi:DNA-binding GntR family transcriptional regulator
MSQNLTNRPEVIDPSRAVSPQLFSFLRDRIVRSDLAPGTRLSEVEIAAHYNTSRQPVREAFIKLSEAGLIEIRPQRGSFVRRIDIASVLAAQFVREAVEADIVRAAAERITDEQARELDSILAAQRDGVDGAPSAFMALDETFHRTIATIAGQGAGWGFLESLRIQMDRVRHLSASQLPREALVVQHTEIAEVIKAGDADGAEQKMRQHLRRVLDDIPVVTAAKPEFFIAEES